MFGGFSHIDVDYNLPPREWAVVGSRARSQMEPSVRLRLRIDRLRLDGIPSRVASLRGFVADLSGFRRSWTVAMNNWEDIPGYKYYVSPGPPHERPELAVAFLNVEQHRDGVVNGCAAP